MKDISPKILELVEFAVDHVVASLKTNEPFVPFVALGDSGPPELHRFVDSTQKASIQDAIAFIESKTDGKFIVLAYDGYIIISDRKNEAILVKANDPSTGKWHIFAQAYKRSEKEIKLLDKIAYLGTTELEVGVN